MAVENAAHLPTEPDVTVVIGTYNGQRYIREQLQSVLAQTVAPAEVIVCDDGSSDATLDIVEEMRAGSPVPVRVVRNTTRLGFADNFLHGAELATSRFVAFCDQDDRWRPDKLEVCRNALIDHDAVVCAHAVELIDGDGVTFGVDRQGIDATRVTEPLSLDPWQKYFGFTLVFERALLGVLPAQERGPDTHAPADPLSHDRWVCFLGFSLGRGVLLQETLAGYRQHGSQLFGSGERRVGRLANSRNRLQHFRASIRDLPVKAAFLAGVCEQRAHLLAVAVEGDRLAVDRAAERWATLAEHYRARAALLEPMALPRRGRGLLRLVRAGVYGAHERGGLGLRALVQDAGACGLSVIGPSR